MLSCPDLLAFGAIFVVFLEITKLVHGRVDKALSFQPRDSGWNLTIDDLPSKLLHDNIGQE